MAPNILILIDTVIQEDKRRTYSTNFGQIALLVLLISLGTALLAIVLSQTSWTCSEGGKFIATRNFPINMAFIQPPPMHAPVGPNNFLATDSRRIPYDMHPANWYDNAQPHWRANQHDGVHRYEDVPPNWHSNQYGDMYQRTNQYDHIHPHWGSNMHEDMYPNWRVHQYNDMPPDWRTNQYDRALRYEDVPTHVDSSRYNDMYRRTQLLREYENESGDPIIPRDAYGHDYMQPNSHWHANQYDYMQPRTNRRTNLDNDWHPTFRTSSVRLPHRTGDPMGAKRREEIKRQPTYKPGDPITPYG